jgi:hypothetical protein
MEAAMIVVVVSGSRSLHIYEVIRRVFERIQEAHPGKEVVLINGGAHGVDTDARIAASSLDWYVETYEPDWRPNGVYDKAAGHKRNAKMVALANRKEAEAIYGIVFMDHFHPTPGTKGMLSIMRRTPYIDTHVYGPQGEQWA